ncbi:hypothetical protein [Haloarchaeobius sp. FL176]|uniref:hypothetical protein n=1 Tax=Haloarchaeobius sp. FL176 TaxID=2967129 RepID=UPI002148F6C5|nr:hypothetical protein [Haloarchaeobius sp. FL176]
MTLDGPRPIQDTERTEGERRRLPAGELEAPRRERLGHGESSNVSPGSHRDTNLKSFIGKSAGETFQLDFAQPGGWVVLQPYEEASPQQ